MTQPILSPTVAQALRLAAEAEALNLHALASYWRGEADRLRALEARRRVREVERQQEQH